VSSPSPQLASLVQHAPRTHASSASGAAPTQQQQQQPPQQQQQQQPAQAQMQQLPSMSASSAEQQAAAAAAVALPSDDFVDEDLDGTAEPASPALKPDGGWGSSEEGPEDDEATSAAPGESEFAFWGARERGLWWEASSMPGQLRHACEAVC
jgi:hypothetical protein